MIIFDHVSKQFNTKQQAIADINLKIDDGEFVFLIGPSGAGKSTLLRLMIRDVLPTEGDIQVNDWHINTIPQSKIHLLRRTVAMVFQDFKLLSDRTIYENVALGLEILGKRKEEIKKRVDEVLDLVGLEEKQLSFPQQLSAGQMQRAAIARAIVGGPKILLTDEPTGNLDPETAWDILDILKEINNMGTTVIMATHNVSFVNHLKKRTIAIRKGRIVSDEEKGQYHFVDKAKHATRNPEKKGE